MGQESYGSGGTLRVFEFLREALYKKELVETKQLVAELSSVLEYFNIGLSREEFTFEQCRRVQKLCNKLSKRSTVLGVLVRNDD